MRTNQFLNLAERVLREQKKPMTCKEIWEIAVNKSYHVTMLNTQGKTPDATLSAELGKASRKNDSIFLCDKTKKPTKYYIEEKKTTNNRTINKKSSQINTIKDIENEREIHPFLTYYAYNFLSLSTKTIYHELSNKGEKGSTEWLHPDVVGVYFPFNDLNKDVINFSNLLGISNVKMVSFEIKRELNFANLRKHYFQAVSNSSWANEGYLVVCDIVESQEFYSELQRLSNSFGIGIIRLNLENIDESEILFNSRYKNNNELDLPTINKLTTENPDFKRFIEGNQLSITIKKVQHDHYDTVYDKNELSKNKLKITL